jgi:uncharacterized protein (TIGR03083 family)
LDKSSYLAAVDSDAAALAAAARAGLDAPAPSCPGWTPGHLVAHVGKAYRWLTEVVETGAQAPLSPDPDRHGFDRSDPGLFDWFEEGRAGFARTLAATDFDEPVWTWSADRRAGFWLRVMAHETALHRWDAQLAHGAPDPIAAELARDGVDYTLDHWLHQKRRLSLLPARGETYHLHRTDGEGEWLLRFEPGEVRVTREHAKGDVALRGSASDLQLYLWRGRREAEAFGDEALLNRYFELVPPT